MADESELSILTSVKARVDKITIDGLKKTKDDLMANMVRNQFKNVDNFQDMLFQAYEVKDKLVSLGIFSRVGISIDTIRGDESSIGYEVIYNVEEKGHLSGKISTTVDNNDGALVLKSEVPNLFGRAEKLSIEYQVSKRSRKGINIDLKVPLKPWTYHNPVFTSSIFQNSADKPWSGFHQTDRGILFDLAFNSFADINHSVRWTGIWREIHSTGSSFQIREQSGHSLKSSIFHTMTLDRRDSPLLPNLGYLVRLNQEYAGLGGDTNFFKHELQISQTIPLISNISVESSIKAGFMNSSSSIADRFFLGGPMSLRGFKMNGVGPHSEGNALGSTTYWIAGLHLYAPLPFKKSSTMEHWLKTHFFLNAGNIGNFSFNGDSVKYFNNLLNRVRLSAGFGIVISFLSLARLELNYCVPLSLQPGDRPDRSFQFGIGFEYV